MVQSSGETTSPLQFSGETILVTRASQQADHFVQQLRESGANAISLPALEIRPPSDWRPLDRQLARLTDFAWLILTSANGVEFFLRRMQAQGYDLSSLATIKIAVVGRKTAHLLEQYGVTPDFIPPKFIADSLAEHFPDRDRLAGSQILYPCLEHDRRELLIAELSNLGATVVDVPAYCSVCPEAIAPEALAALQQGVDAITFASSKTVHYFHQLLEQSQNELRTSIPEMLESVAIASIGPLTSATCQKVLGRVDIQPEEYTLDGLMMSMIQWFSHSR